MQFEPSSVPCPKCQEKIDISQVQVLVSIEEVIKRFVDVGLELKIRKLKAKKEVPQPEIKVEVIEPTDEPQASPDQPAPVGIAA